MPMILLFGKALCGMTWRIWKNCVHVGFVLALTLSAVHGADVITYVLGKNHHFDQFGSTPIENTLGEAWEAGANVYLTSPGSVVSASVTLPAASVTLPLNDLGPLFQLSEYFDLKADLDSTIPSAQYILSITTLHDGIKTCALTLGADAYPNAPLILSSNEAQQIAPSSAFTLKWAPFTGATVNDYILVVAAPDYGASPTNYYSSPLPNQVGVLLGTNTQVTIPANTFPAGSSGYFKVGFFKMVDKNTTGYPGVPGFAGYGAITKMPFQTLTAPTITQPLPLTLITNAGANVTFDAGASGAALNYQWRKDGAAILNATNSSYTLSNVRSTNAASYSVRISNAAGAVTNGPVNLVINSGTPGSLDTDFSVGLGGNGPVRALAVRPDGRIIAGGSFTTFNQLGNPRIISLTATGGVDGAFSVPSGADNDVHALVLQPDGKLIVGGSFNFIGGAQHPGITRLLTTGALDTTFATGTGSSTVYALALRSDGKIAMGGAFLSFNGIPRTRVALLQSNGTLDTSFTANCNGDVRALTFLPDNRLMIAGAFTTVNGTVRPVIARVLADGTLDPSFNAPTNINFNAYAVALQPDGKILVAGAFDHLNQLNIGRILRLNADGSVDTTFRSGVGASGNIRSLVLQPDNKILIGGEFTGYDNLNITRVARLNPDGSLDKTFSVGTGANNIVMNLIQQPDAKVVVGGFFTTFNGIANASLARINNDPIAPTPVFTYQPVNRVVFAGEDAAFYTSVNCATPVSYQWQTNGVDVAGATNSSIRITAAQAANEASYTVRVTAAGNSIVSTNATLTVLPQPQLLEHLAHRYSFSEFAGATQVVDSIGNAHGTLVSAGAAEGLTGSGQLTLAGLGGYVSLPGGLISAHTNVTLEMWLTWNGPTNQQYQTFFYAAGGSSQFHLMPFSDFPTARLFFSTNITVIARPVLRNLPPPAGVPVHFAVVYQPNANTSKLYMNGQLVAIGSAPSPLSGLIDSNIWLGRSPSAPFLNGVLDEFRIYDDALSDAAIAASYQAGPNAQQLSINVDLSGANLVLSWPLSGAPLSVVATSDLALGFQPFTYTPITNGNTVSVNLPTSGAHAYYRLRSP